MSVSRRQLRAECRTWDGFLALGMGSGLAPKAPGTMGTLASILPGYWLTLLGPVGFPLVLAVAFLLGVVVCGRVGRRLGVGDHGAIVWDEFVGYWICLIFVPARWEWMIAAFILFRVFDIFKPWPIRCLEVRVPGGLGVMLDDIIAALMASVVLLGLQQIPALVSG